MKRRETIEQYKARRRKEIRRRVLTPIISIVALGVIVITSNWEITKAQAQAGRIITFDTRYAVIKDSGLTIVVHGGKADGHVYDIAPEKAKKFEDGTHVEVIFDTKETEDVTDDEPIKVTDVKDLW